MALQNLAKGVFQDNTFEDVLMGIGIVATRWMTESPMIFKGSVVQAPWSGRNLQSKIRGQGQSDVYGE